MPGPLNEVQQQVIQKVYDLLGEHFDNAVFIVSTDVYIGDRFATAQKMLFKGGAMAALGMLSWGGDQILDIDRRVAKGGPENSTDGSVDS